MPYILVDTKEKLQELLEVLLKFNGNLYADIESTGLNWLVNHILLFQLLVGEVIYIVDVRKLGYDLFTNVIEMIRATHSRVAFHNAKFDLKFIYHRTKIILPKVYDTMTSEAVLVAGIGKTFYSLAELAEKYTDTFMDKKERSEFIDFPVDREFTESMLIYAARDVKILKTIVEKQLEQFSNTKQLKVMELDNDLISVVAKMEYDGIRLDSKEWLEVEALAKEELISLYEKIRPEVAEFVITKKLHGVTNGLQLAEKLCIPVKGKARCKALEDITDLSNMKQWIIDSFNFRSPKQKVALMNVFGIKATSADAKYLRGKFNDKELVQKLLKLAEVEKQISQYGSGFLKDLNPITERVHTEYLTVGTQTGRFSSSRPNLQNIPTHGGYRECFIPSDDYLYITCDYSQQEYRLTGAVSREPVIIDAYRKGSDMHIATAANFYNKALEEVTKEERSWGKTRNFEIIYGTTEYGLSQSLKSSIDHALSILKKYWDGYPTLSAFKLKAEEAIMKLGYSCTPLGRRRYNLEKPIYNDSRGFMKWQSRVKREGFNHIVQGGGADIIKIAMVNIFNRNPFGESFRILLQIHDELLIEVHKDIADEARAFIEKEMMDAEQPFLGEIPAVVESQIKTCWSK